MKTRANGDILKYHPETNTFGVMDATAVALLREHKLPLAVFSIFEENGFANVLAGKGKHTLITQPE